MESVGYSVRGLQNIKVNNAPVDEVRYIASFRGRNIFVNLDIEALTLVRTDNGVRTEVKKLDGN